MNETGARRHILPFLAAFLAGGLVLAIGLGIIYARFWPENPINLTLSITSPQHSPLIYTAKYCKHTALPALVDRGLIGVGSNRSSYAFPPVASIIHPGCGIVHIPLVLPAGLAPGHYVLREALIFHYNSIRDVTVYFQSNVFWVTP